MGLIYQLNIKNNEVEKYEELNISIDKQINNYIEVIEDGNMLISELRNTIELTQTEIDVLRNKNISITSEFDKNVELLNKSITKKDNIIQRAEENLICYSILENDTIVGVHGTTESDIQSLFGEGVQESYQVFENSESYWLNGLHGKKMNYDSIDVYYLKYSDKGDFWFLK